MVIYSYVEHRTSVGGRFINLPPQPITDVIPVDYSLANLKQNKTTKTNFHSPMFQVFILLYLHRHLKYEAILGLVHQLLSLLSESCY